MRKVFGTWALVGLIAFAPVAVLSVGQTAFAALPQPGDDLFGIYAGTNFNEDPSDDNPPYVDAVPGAVTVYVYLTNVTAPTIGAYEFALNYSGGTTPQILEMVLPPESIDLGNGKDFVVVLETPLPPDPFGHVILMSLTYLVTETAPVQIAVGPTSTPMLQNQISYLEAAMSPHIRAMNPLSGSFDDPIFSFNPTNPAVESTSWSDIKSKYR